MKKRSARNYHSFQNLLFSIILPRGGNRGIQIFPVTKAVSNNEMYLTKASITDNRTAAHSQQQHFLGR